MPVTNTTANRGYQIPHASNLLDFDIARLISALNAIDVDVANFLTVLATKAPLNNANLTGTPTVPTVSAGDNSTKPASTAWVRGFLSDFIGSAPGTLDTIAELAEALQNNPDIISEMLTAIGGKLAKDQNLDDLADKAAARNNLDVYARGATVAADAKATPIDADVFGFFDSAASWALKKLTWANIKAALKAYFDALYATAGHVHTFASITSKPTTVSGYGITDASQLGVGQTWQNVKASRAVNTVYQNTSGKPIVVAIGGYNAGGLEISQDNTNWFFTGNWNPSFGLYVQAVVPNGHYYRVGVGGGINNGSWSELR